MNWRRRFKWWQKGQSPLSRPSASIQVATKRQSLLAYYPGLPRRSPEVLVPRNYTSSDQSQRRWNKYVTRLLYISVSLCTRQDTIYPISLYMNSSACVFRVQNLRKIWGRSEERREEDLMKIWGKSLMHCRILGLLSVLLRPRSAVSQEPPGRLNTLLSRRSFYTVLSQLAVAYLYAALGWPISDRVLHRY